MNTSASHPTLAILVLAGLLLNLAVATTLLLDVKEVVADGGSDDDDNMFCRKLSVIAFSGNFGGGGGF